MPIIDVHCHLFNKDVLTLGGKIIAALGDIITDLIDNGNYEDADTKIKRINAFVEMSEKKSAKIADALFRKYGEGSIIVPLMYDMYYLTHDQQKDFTDQLAGLLERFDVHDHKGNAKVAEIKEGLEGIKGKVLKDLADEALRRDSFDIQVKGMAKLKKSFKDGIYPFISFDPRRSGNIEAIKGSVGAGKTFQGVKLYPPLGFSAAHPAMMDKQNGLYAWCVANDIPITAHCSCPGMPTMNDRLYVPHGSLVFDETRKAVVKTTMDEVIDFSDKSAETKSQYFNHPEIWRRVLDEFPSLRLNLAHFGGGSDDWRALIAGMINSNSYQNLYTDISCRTEADALADIRSKYDASEALKRRLMYGSDFTILLLSSDLTDFCAGVDKTFPADADKAVYWDNARRFLKLP